MRKKQFKMVGASAMALMTALAAMPVGSALAAPPVYRSNEYDDMMITRIIPAESYVEMTYLPTGRRAERQTPLFVNLQFGGLTDAQLHGIGTGSFGAMHQQILGVGGSNLSSGELASGQVVGFGRERMIAGVDLLDNSMHMIDYVVRYNAGGEEQKSRADYRRCVESSVFMTGEATECRLERTGGGRVQYQPYTAEGVRVAIPAEEDAMLTAMTEEWRAEPGEWGPEWYDAEDDGSGSGAEGGDDSGSDGGGGPDAGSEGTGPSAEGEGDGGGSEGGSGGAEDINTGKDGDDEGEEDGGAEGDGGTESDDAAGTAAGGADGDGGEAGAGGTEATGAEGGSAAGDRDAVVVDGVAVAADAVLNTSVANAVGANDANAVVTNGDVAGSFAYWGELMADDGWSEVAVTETTEANEGENTEEVTGFIESALTNGTSANDEVGVPELGKETGAQPNWAAITAIGMASVAGLVGWAILFFGKHHHLIKRKETKE